MSDAGEHRVVRVEPASAPAYEVRIGPGVAPAFAPGLAALLGSAPRRLFAVIDAGIPDDWVEAVLGAYEAGGYGVERFTIEPSENVGSPS